MNPGSVSARLSAGYIVNSQKRFCGTWPRTKKPLNGFMGWFVNGQLRVEMEGDGGRKGSRKEGKKERRVDPDTKDPSSFSN